MKSMRSVPIECLRRPPKLKGALSELATPAPPAPCGAASASFGGLSGVRVPVAPPHAHPISTPAVRRYTSRNEMATSVRRLVSAYADGRLEPDDISPELIERCLLTSSPVRTRLPRAARLALHASRRTTPSSRCAPCAPPALPMSG